MQKIVVIGYTSSQNDYSALIITKLRPNEPLRPLKELVEEVGPFPNFNELKEKLTEKLGDYQSK